MYCNCAKQAITSNLVPIYLYWGPGGPLVEISDTHETARHTCVNVKTAVTPATSHGCHRPHAQCKQGILHVCNSLQPFVCTNTWSCRQSVRRRNIYHPLKPSPTPIKQCSHLLPDQSLLGSIFCASCSASNQQASAAWTASWCRSATGERCRSSPPAS